MMACTGAPSRADCGRWGYAIGRSLWQNPYVERLIGTLLRDCLHHLLIFGEEHLRRVLNLYSFYYNETRNGRGSSSPPEPVAHLPIGVL